MPGLLIYSAPQIKKKKHLLGCMLKTLESVLLATWRYITWFPLAVLILCNSSLTIPQVLLESVPFGSVFTFSPPLDSEGLLY